MLSPWTIVAIAIVILLFLISVAIMAAVAAGDSYGSPDYNSDNRIRSAHTSMTVCACLGFAAAFVMFVVTVILTYKVVTLSKAFKVIEMIGKSTSPLSIEQDASVARSRDEIRDLHKSITILLIVSVVVCLTASAIIGILSIVAASNLGNATKSTKVSKAYTLAIIISIIGILAFFASIAFTTVGFLITKEEKKMGEKADEIIKQNNVKPVPQPAVVTKL